MEADIGRDFSFSDITKAIQLAKRTLESKSQKAAERIIGKKEMWSPPDNNAWMTFEEMRMHNLRHRALREDYLDLVWSPVEIWMVFKCPNRSDSGRHLISLLTGESYYTIRHDTYIEADDSPAFPKRRAYQAALLARTVDEVERKARTPITPLLYAICTT